MAKRKAKHKTSSARNLVIVFSKFIKRPSSTNYIWALLVFLFGLGQGLVIKGQIFLGLTCSLIALILGLLVYFYGLKKALELLSVVFGSAPAGKDRASKSSSVRSSGADHWQNSMVVWLFLAITGLVLAGIGQAYMCQSGNPSTLPTGQYYFLAAVVLFVAGFWPWRREGLMNAPISFRWEMVALGAILVLAAFLRVYRIGTIPSGLFIDQGFQGYAALRILHEGWHPFYVEEIFHAYALGLYMLAGWFAIFGSSDVSLRLFYVFLSLVSMPLIYWTFRQLAGPRVALLSLFILAVMRWHINFSRNGFPTVQLPLYMFGTLAFLLYGLKTSKRWAYILSAVFFAAGFYTYQAFKVFPLLLLAYAIYELITNWKTIKKNRKFILLFLAISIGLTSFMLVHMYVTKIIDTRFGELSIWPKCRQAHSLKPFFDVVYRTALMFNRQGDPNPRHNLQDFRMLDDVSGALLILGLGYALVRGFRRKYFYALAGFFIMSLPCILTIDAAHANRLFGMTPFMAFLIATPLTAVWGRMRAFKGKIGEGIFLILLAGPLYLMTLQNFDVYFKKQANSFGSWAEYSICETTIGRAIAQKGKSYEYYISPRFFNFFSVIFYGYSELSQIHSLDLPGTLVPLSAPADHGLFFALENGKTGILNLLQKIYPEGRTTSPKDPNGQTFLYFFEVPQKVWEKTKGMKAKLSNRKGEITLPQFPQGFPPGPYHATLTGSLYSDQTGECGFLNEGPGQVGWYIDGKEVTGSLKLLKGYTPVRLEWDAPEGAQALSLAIDRPKDGKTPLDSRNLTTLRVPRGMRVKYFKQSNWKGEIVLEQWEPTPNFTNGNDFPNRYGSILWEGMLRVPVAGNYAFSVVTGEQAGLVIDGKEILPFEFSGSRAAEAYLTEGPHPLKLYYRGSMGFSTISLYWKKPRGKDREVISADAFE